MEAGQDLLHPDCHEVPTATQLRVVGAPEAEVDPVQLAAEFTATGSSGNSSSSNTWQRNKLPMQLLLLQLVVLVPSPPIHMGGSCDQPQDAATAAQKASYDGAAIAVAETAAVAAAAVGQLCNKLLGAQQ